MAPNYHPQSIVFNFNLFYLVIYATKELALQKCAYVFYIKFPCYVHPPEGISGPALPTEYQSHTRLQQNEACDWSILPRAYNCVIRPQLRKINCIKKRSLLDWIWYCGLVHFFFDNNKRFETFWTRFFVKPLSLTFSIHKIENTTKNLKKTLFLLYDLKYYNILH